MALLPTSLLPSGDYAITGEACSVGIGHAIGSVLSGKADDRGGWARGRRFRLTARYDQEVINGWGWRPF